MIQLLVIAKPDAPYLHLLDQLQQPVNVLIGDDPEFLRQHAPNADVILNDMSGGSLETVLKMAQKVCWIHTPSAGVDKVLFPALITSPVPLTNARGVFKDALAEFAMAAILFFAKDLRRLVRQQENGVWEQFDVSMIRGQTLGIIGYGEIGRESARLARALGMRVAPLRRRPDSTAPLQEEEDERVFGPGDLMRLLETSDYLLLSAPLTSETRGLIGARELAAMKKTAVLINVGRGPVVDEAALIAALTSGQIRGAAIDVYAVEPLPGDHPFYGLKNVLLSPHSADHAVGWSEWATLGFIENFRRFQNGEPLENVVDKHAGY